MNILQDPFRMAFLFFTNAIILRVSGPDIYFLELKLIIPKMLQEKDDSMVQEKIISRVRCHPGQS